MKAKQPQRSSKQTLVKDVSSVYAFFFVLYIACVTFATFRIITALFLRDTLCVATADTELMIQEKIREKESYAQKLRFFFEVADTNGDGVLTREDSVCLVAKLGSST